MKPRDVLNILVQALTAAWWSGFTALIIFIPMVLLGVPHIVGLVVVLGLALITATLTAYGAVCLHRERQRRSKGQCIRCGYDLRGATDRCPECGKRVGRKMTA